MLKCLPSMQEGGPGIDLQYFKTKQNEIKNYSSDYWILTNPFPNWDSLRKMWLVRIIWHWIVADTLIREPNGDVNKKWTP
jgi:hypothetical protein